MANAIKTYFGDGSEWGVELIYSDEPVPLGTAGSVRNADGPPRRALPRHLRRRASPTSTSASSWRSTTSRRRLATIGLIRVENPLEFGIVITREDGTIERFLEKPSWGQVFSDTINTGIYVLEPEIFDMHRRRPGRRLLGRGLPGAARRRPAAVRRHRRRLLGGRRHPRRLPASAHHDVLDQRVLLDIPGFQVSDGVWLGEGAEISPERRRSRGRR